MNCESRVWAAAGRALFAAAARSLAKNQPIVAMLEDQNLPQLQVYYPADICKTCKPNYNHDSIPEVSSVSVRNHLKYSIVQYLLLEIVCLCKVGEVDTGVIQWRQCRAATAHRHIHLDEASAERINVLLYTRSS